jgi:HPt (histidine-containing phosphotransfer) domain-containing protein
MFRLRGNAENQNVLRDPSIVLDLEQLRDVTLDDELLMREILAALLDDTSRQIILLEQAIRNCDPQATRRLAHYSKGACANVGANAVAAVLESIEHTAVSQDFEACRSSLQALSVEMERLRAETIVAGEAAQS